MLVLQDQESCDELHKFGYDKFVMTLRSVQILYATPGENWQAARLAQHKTKLHIIDPINLDIDIYKLYTGDPKQPKHVVALLWS